MSVHIVIANDSIHWGSKRKLLLWSWLGAPYYQGTWALGVAGFRA